eukprot:g2308.t1
MGNSSSTGSVATSQRISTRGSSPEGPSKTTRAAEDVEDTGRNRTVSKLLGDYNCVEFQRKKKGRWNPWDGAIHYQISLRRIDEKDIECITRYGATRPDFHFVYAENGYVVDTGRVSARVLMTVREGYAQVFGKSIVLNNSKELQKLMLVRWHEDGRPPSADVSKEQLCVISPPSRVPLNISKSATLLTMRKTNSYQVQLWKSTSRRAQKTMEKLDRLQALFGTRLQWVSDVARPIAAQLSIAEAKEHYESLDVLLASYDPDLGDAEAVVGDNHTPTAPFPSSASASPSTASKLTHGDFIARNIEHSEEEEGELIAVRDITTGALVSVHDMEKPHTLNDSRDAGCTHEKALQTHGFFLASPSTTLSTRQDAAKTPVYDAVWNLLTPPRSNLSGGKGRVTSLRWFDPVECDKEGGRERKYGGKSDEASTRTKIKYNRKKKTRKRAGEEAKRRTLRHRSSRTGLTPGYVVRPAPAQAKMPPRDDLAAAYQSDDTESESAGLLLVASPDCKASGNSEIVSPTDGIVVVTKAGTREEIRNAGGDKGDSQRAFDF